MHVEPGVWHLLPPDAAHWSQEWQPDEDRFVLIFYGKQKPTTFRIKRPNEVYVQTTEGVEAIPMASPTEVQEFHRGTSYWQQLDRVQNTFFLRLKANGCELDPKYFNAEEKKGFGKADAKEWTQRIVNKIVERLKEMNEYGDATVYFKSIDLGTPVVVTPFDASFSKE